MPVEPPEVKGLLPGRGPAGRAPPGRGAPWPHGTCGTVSAALAATATVTLATTTAVTLTAYRGRTGGTRAGGGAGGTGGLLRRGRLLGRSRSRELRGGHRGDRGGLRRGPGARTGTRRRRGGRRGGAARRSLRGGKQGPGRRASGQRDVPRRPGTAPRASRGRPCGARQASQRTSPALPPGPCSASVSLRTTGASIVEDAERTNSPSSWSLAMTTLLSTPNSLASSYTRTLATSLLLGPGYRRTVATSWAYSSRTHRVLIAISTYFQLARYLTARGPVPFTFLRCHPLDEPLQCGGVERPLGLEGPGECPAADRQVETDRGGVYVRTPAGQRTAWIRDNLSLVHHDAQQLALGRSLPASHTGSLGASAGVRPARHG